MPTPATDRLPPPRRRDLWLTFLGWTLGTPAAVAAALGIVWAALRLSGGSLMPRAEFDMATVLFWLGVIVLLYPAMLWVWLSELREGLARAREWEALSPEARSARLAAQTGAAPSPRRRRARRGGRP